MLQLDRPWTTQPQEEFTLNTTNPIAHNINRNGVASLWTRSNNNEAGVLAGAPWNLSNGMMVRNSGDVRGAVGNGTTGYYSRFISAMGISGVRPHVLLCVWKQGTVSTNGKTYYGIGSSAVSLGAVYHIASGNSGGGGSEIFAQVRSLDGSIQIQTAVGPTPEMGKIYAAAWVVSSIYAINNRLFVNGIEYPTSGGDLDFASTSILYNESVGALKRGTVLYYSDSMILFTGRYVPFSGTIADMSDLQEWTRNPWNIFTPRPLLLPAYTPQGKLLGTTISPIEPKILPTLKRPRTQQITERPYRLSELGRKFPAVALVSQKNLINASMHQFSIISQSYGAGAPVFATNSFGDAMQGGGTSSAYAFTLGKVITGGATKGTWVFVCNRQDNTVSSYPQKFYGANIHPSGGDYRSYFTYTANTQKITIYLRSGNFDTFTTREYDFIAGCFVLCWDGGFNLRAYINGTQVQPTYSVDGTTLTTIVSAGLTDLIGNVTDGGGNLAINLAGLAPTNISHSEAINLSGDPNLLFEPSSINVPHYRLGSLVASSTTQDASSGTDSVTQIHVTVADTTTQNATSSLNVVTSVQYLVGAPSNQVASSTTASIVHLHNIVAATTVQDAASTTSAISQQHNVTASTTTQNADSGTNYIGSEGFFSGGSTTQNSSSSTNVITLVQTLTGDSTTQTATSELDSITNIHIVVAAPTNQTAASSTYVIQQVHFVSGAPSSQGNSANTSAVTLVQVLSGDSSSQNAGCTTGSVDQIHIVTAATTVQSADSGTGIYTSTQLLYADPDNQTATSTSNSIVHIHILLASNSTQAANDSVFAITQDHELASTTDIQSNSSSTSTAEIGLYVIADSSTQTSSSSTNVITLIQLLAAADSVSSTTSTENGITQVHILLDAPSYQNNYSESNVIVHVHNLSVSTDTQLNQSTAEEILANAYREGYYISSEAASVVIVSTNGDTFIVSNPDYRVVTATDNAVIITSVEEDVTVEEVRTITAANDVSIEYYRFNKAA